MERRPRGRPPSVEGGRREDKVMKPATITPITDALHREGSPASREEVLAAALRDARDEIAALREEVDKLCAPPSTYGVYLSANQDGTVTVLSQGRKVKVNIHPTIKVEALKPGQELILNEGLNVVEAAGY
ncbi:MAG: hypothetical protein EHM88_22755, partial [Candidatus Rokuibacteriota bacterium]